MAVGGPCGSCGWAADFSLKPPHPAIRPPADSGEIGAPPISEPPCTTPFLKSVFADRQMVGILIRRHVPEWADEIDVATLREEPNELVAGKTWSGAIPT